MRQIISRTLKISSSLMLATLVGLTGIEGGFIRPANGALVSSASSDSMSLSAGSWLAVLGEDSSSSSTGPLSVMESVPSGDILGEADSANEYVLNLQCDLEQDDTSIYLDRADSNISPGMTVTDVESGSVVGIVESIKSHKSYCRNGNSDWQTSAMKVTMFSGALLRVPSGGELSFKAPIYYEERIECETSSRGDNGDELFLKYDNSWIQPGMIVTSSEADNSQDSVTYGVVESTSTSARYLRDCEDARMLVKLVSRVSESVSANQLLRFTAPEADGSEVQICSTSRGYIYLDNPTSTIQVGTDVFISGEQIGSVESIDRSYSDSYCSQANFRAQLSGSIDIAQGDVVTFGANNSPQVIGHTFSKVVSLNNIGSQEIDYVIITHTNSRTVLKLCSGRYISGVCNGIEQTVTEGQSNSVLIRPGASAQVLVTLSVEDLVTDLEDTLSVAISRP